MRACPRLPPASRLSRGGGRPCALGYVAPGCALVEKSVSQKLRFPAKFVAPYSAVARERHPFPPLAKRGFGGVVPASPATGACHALFLSVLAHPTREARRTGLDFQGLSITPPSQGGERESPATSFQRATRTRPSIPSLQLGSHPVFIFPGVGGVSAEAHAMHRKTARRKVFDSLNRTSMPRAFRLSLAARRQRARPATLAWMFGSGCRRPCVERSSDALHEPRRSPLLLLGR